MDRGEGAIRWSPTQARDEFLTLDFHYRIIDRYKATGKAAPEQFDYEQVSKSTDFQVVKAFDWSPKVSGLVAIGGKDGEVQLLRIDDNSNDSIVLPLKLQRTCQAVAFNTTGLLAVGLDRVRNGECLQIWDVDQRLSKWDPSKKGWQSSASAPNEPLYRLEPSVSVTSVRFFEDQPQTLVVGIKNQSLRIHDLRDPHGAVASFQTRCNNNLAIDHADPNYFASTALDQPSVMIWDRRATSRQSASKMYLEAVDDGDVPFGCALKLKSAIDSRNGANIRSLRYCRDRRGYLAVLSSAGELQVLCTQREYVEPLSESDVDESPELLEVKTSHTLQHPYFDENFNCRYDDRIGSSDWASLGSPDFQPRLVTRRCNQKIEVMLMPTAAQHLAFDLINFSAKANNYEYTNLPKFQDPNEEESILSSIAMADVQRNGVFRPSIGAAAPTGMASDPSTQPGPVTQDTVYDHIVPGYGWVATKSADVGSSKNLEDVKDLSIFVKKPLSSRERHEQSQWLVLDGECASGVLYAKVNRMMFNRCKKGYLFDYKRNRDALREDPWLQGVWRWIARAETLAKNDGMVFKRAKENSRTSSRLGGEENLADDDAKASFLLDLSFMGVATIWNNDLGNKSKSRVSPSANMPSSVEWKHAIEDINDRASRAQFEGVKTDKPHHRQLGLAICGWGKSIPDLEKALKELEAQGQYTKAAAWALYEKIPHRAVEILRRGGKDFLFIGLALDLYLKAGQAVEYDNNTWDAVLQEHPEMMGDPYLRAIYALISTGNWKAVANEQSLPLRDRSGVALRYFDDGDLTNWLEERLAEAIKTGDIEGIVLTGITDQMVDILAKYLEKFADYQTATLIMSSAAPLYIDDYRCSQWREKYREFLNANKLHIDRAKFDVQSTRKSKQRDGTTVIKPSPRQVTLRCVRCDAALTNDLASTANPPTSTSAATAERSNPLYPSGVHSGISCPKCGRHLGRCAVCLQTLGMPRTDRPELSTEQQNALANFMTFCLKCDHACHADHSRAWFSRHNECPAPDCRCPCNEQDIRIKAEHEARKEADVREGERQEAAKAAKDTSEKGQTA